MTAFLAINLTFISSYNSRYKLKNQFPKYF